MGERMGAAAYGGACGYAEAEWACCKPRSLDQRSMRSAASSSRATSFPRSEMAQAVIDAVAGGADWQAKLPARHRALGDIEADA